MIHSGTPSSTSWFDHVPPSLKGSERTVAQCARSWLESAICVLNALPITLAGLISTGDRIQSNLCPSTNEKTIFDLAVVASAFLLYFGLSLVDHRQIIAFLLILFVIVTAFLLKLVVIVVIQIERPELRTLHVRLRLVEEVHERWLRSTGTTKTSSRLSARRR